MLFELVLISTLLGVSQSLSPLQVGQEVPLESATCANKDRHEDAHHLEVFGKEHSVNRYFKSLKAPLASTPSIYSLIHPPHLCANRAVSGQITRDPTSSWE